MLYFKSTGRFALFVGLLAGQSWCVSAIEKTQSLQLIDIVDRAVASHPLMQRAVAKLDQVKAQSRANSQPLYNPELELAYESNVDDTSMIGLSQTFDWSDKQAALKQIGSKNQRSAEAEFIGVRQSIVVDLLRKINRYQASNVAASLNSRQLDTLEEFVKIAQKRFSVGDISQIELDLALLASGELRMRSAKIQANNYNAKLQLESFFNFEKIDVPKLNIALISDHSQDSEQLLQRHPKLVQLRMASESARAEIKLSERKKTADPTFSINAGKEGKENIINLGFSMPLHIRNNFSAEVDSAIANSVAVEQEYLNNYRQVLVDVKSTKRDLELTLSAYRRWISQSQTGLEARAKLLQRLWKSGDLGTTEYLVQIQQTLDTLIAATQLKEDVLNAWFDYLAASGQIDDWLALK